MNWLKRILTIFLVLVLVAIAFPLYAYLTVDRSSPIPIAAINLVTTGDNAGFRCPKQHWNGLSESPVCYSLQEELSLASSEGDSQAVIEILRKGANADGSYYQSDGALSTAALTGHVEVVRVLIGSGADVNSLGKWRLSPLHVAINYDQYLIAKLLLENGADSCLEAALDDASTPTALDLALRKRNYEMIKLLTAHGALFCFSQYQIGD